MFGQFRMHLREARDQTGRAMEDYMHTCTYLPTCLPTYLPTYLPTLPYPTQPYRTHRSFYPGSNNGCQARLIPVGMPVPSGCNARPIPRWLYSCNHLFRTTGHPWSKHVKTKFAISAFSSLRMMPWMLTEQAHFAADLDGGPEGCHVALGFGCSFEACKNEQEVTALSSFIALQQDMTAIPLLNSGKVQPVKGSKAKPVDPFT